MKRSPVRHRRGPGFGSFLAIGITVLIVNLLWIAAVVAVILLVAKAVI